MAADSGAGLAQMNVDGGAAANDFLMQFQADVLGCPVARPAQLETTALGAAYLAGLATGFWAGMEDLAAARRVERRFDPAMGHDQRQDLRAAWRTAVERARTAH
jgi:glycerol kinase